MAVDPKTMKAEDFAKVSSIDFVYTFNKNMKQVFPAYAGMIPLV